MIKRQQPYVRQIFVCVNHGRGEGPSCGRSGSEEIFQELKERAKEFNAKGKGKVRVAKSGCLDLCAFGPNIMIWPEGIWCMKVTKEDIPSIVDTCLMPQEADTKEEYTSPPVEK